MVDYEARLVYLYKEKKVSLSLGHHNYRDCK